MKSTDLPDLLERAAQIPRQRILRDQRRASWQTRPLFTFLASIEILFDPYLDADRTLPRSIPRSS